MSFGSNMKAMREKLGISQEELAKRVYVSPGMICHIEMGKRAPSLSLALGIAEVLGTDVETLAGVKENE